MKYPQLVSTRAVNAISDWLVSRLEQLGVEAPQIYTRLLLSLLQSTVHINDPIEFSNLESFFANRKGGNKRFLSCDTDTLKKLNAIQCLRDIVSSEQEIVNIENLIEELCEKLKDIEQQTAGNENEDHILVATLSLSHQHQHQHQIQEHSVASKYHSNSLSYSGFKEESVRLHKNYISGEKTKADLESDPKKSYFRAFPALSKEMEDSFRIWRHNAKSLTWPVDRNVMSISNSSSSSTISSSFGSGGSRGALISAGGSAIPASVNFNKDVVDGEIKIGKFTKDYIGSTMSEVKNEKLSQHFSAEGINDTSGGFNISNMISGGIKRKPKRRRGQGKSTQQTRKGASGNIGGTTPQTSNDTGSVGTIRKYNRNTTPTYWDTDFEGCWEMGRDLIKEFIVRQNGKGRNRSTSESSAIRRRELHVEANADIVKNQVDVKKKQNINGEEDIIKEKLKMCSPLPPNVDISFCDDDYDDTLASISELTNDFSLNAMSTAPAKRLYEREQNDLESHEVLGTDNKEDKFAVNEQLDFAQFEAKFNSSVEALWKDDDSLAINAFDLSGSSVQMPAALPITTSLTQNLKNFWANYYNHHFDLNKILPEANFPTKRSENCSSVSYCSLNPELNMNEMTTTSDYFSMPSKFEDTGRQVRAQRQNNKNEECNTPVALFLQNSIWSENCNIGGGDTDESFYLKVQNSAIKLNTLVAESKKDTGFSAVSGPNLSETNNDGTFPFPPYNVSKWSEGINAGPNIQMQQSQLQKAAGFFRNNRAPDTKRDNFNLLSLSANCTDSCTNSSHSTRSSRSSTATVYNWQTPLSSQNVQSGLQSWPTSDPLPLAEMFEADVDNTTLMKNISKNSSVSTHIADLNDPAVTLANHSATSSGFIEYSRIKSKKQLMKQSGAKEQTKHPPQLQRSNEQYADDENLLTSERTHFHPIKSYADGHTFDICSDLDLIHYKRSESGYLYLENEKYLEYTRSDIFMVEDDAASMGPGVGASANPLYANSNCEAAVGRQQRYSTRSKRNQMHDFVIRFRVQSTEIACQTEDNLEIGCESKRSAMLPQHPLYVIFSNAAKNMKQSSFNPICHNTVEAFNQAVSATSHLPPSNLWQPASNIDGSFNSAYKAQSLAWNISQRQGTPTDNKIDDGGENVKVNFFDANAKGADRDADMSSLEQQQWSMNEIRKKCQMAGHSTNYTNSNKTAGCGAEVESVWGMCAACNSELKSIPANRLLRDELKLEADEIMSDLKYMQDLYIGRADGGSDTASESDWTVAEDTTEEENGKNKLEFGAVQCEKANDLNAAGNLCQENCSSIQRAEELEKRGNLTFDNGEQILRDAVIETVNRFITEWLCPENIENSENCEKESSDTESSICDRKEYSSNLWHASSNEHNIWQLSEADGNNGNALKPLTLLRHFNVKPVEDKTMQMNEDKFLAELSWEHENLAKIWQNTSPPDHNDSNGKMTTKCLSSQIRCLHDEVPKSEGNVETEIADRNLRNLENPITITTDIPDFSQIKAMSSSTATLNVNEGIQRVFNTLDTAISPAEKFRVANRKRRHSASQNFFHTQSSFATDALTNNNNDYIADLNRYSLKSVLSMEPIVAIAKTSAKNYDNMYSSTMGFQNLSNASICLSATEKRAEYVSAIYSDDPALYNSTQMALKRQSDVGNTTVNELQKQRRNHTIITCKYHLTSIEPMAHEGSADIDLFTGGTTLSCLIDKNASILNHVTMVTRPLTR